MVKLIAAAITVIAAYSTAVFSWAGLLLMIEEAGFSTAVIGTAIGTLVTFLTAQATTMVNLHGEAVDATSFPGGKWPSPNSSTYNDATLTEWRRRLLLQALVPLLESNQGPDNKTRDRHAVILDYLKNLPAVLGSVAAVLVAATGLLALFVR